MPAKADEYRRQTDPKKPRRKWTNQLLCGKENRRILSPGFPLGTSHDNFEKYPDGGRRRLFCSGSRLGRIARSDFQPFETVATRQIFGHPSRALLGLPYAAQSAGRVGSLPRFAGRADRLETDASRAGLGRCRAGYRGPAGRLVLRPDRALSRNGPDTERRPCRPTHAGLPLQRSRCASRSNLPAIPSQREGSRDDQALSSGVLESPAGKRPTDGRWPLPHARIAGKGGPERNFLRCKIQFTNNADRYPPRLLGTRSGRIASRVAGTTARRACGNQ